MSADREVDDVAVDRAVFGDRMALTVAEKALAIARLTRAGLSGRVIAERLGLCRRQVTRYRTGRAGSGRGHRREAA